ncbi:hypothetical protein KEM48_003782 [Puccinia striiformis f. sp. tritici PST-130]|nr:hypothetical protein KEM48_003782 [Puccinia striiformis f. sp. tritici PST-130]
MAARKRPCTSMTTRSSTQAHQETPKLDVESKSESQSGSKNPPQSNQHSAEWTNQVLLKILKLRVVRRAVEDAEAGQSNRTATAQAMSQPLSSQENNSQPNKAEDDIDPTTRRSNFHQTNKEFDRQDYSGRGLWSQ